MTPHTRLLEVTEKLIRRSRSGRRRYLENLEHSLDNAPSRERLSCGNLAHAIAGCNLHDKERLGGEDRPNIGIVTAYNDMLSAHKPYETYPDFIRKTAHELGASAQVAGGVPAMCDGVTQGQIGMELSLFSRDVIAMSTAIALSHQMYDGALYLGICDKIVPGLLIGALSFGHLPGIFVPAGPMPSGLPNEEKSRIRKLFVQGKVSRQELLKAETASYHSPGTCTFYGTANSNQMLMEIMGLHLPGASFVNPGTKLRDALTREAVSRIVTIGQRGNQHMPLGHIICEKSIINGVVGLLATGGSTNHTLHLVAIAAAAGIDLRWEDIADLSSVIPLIVRVYPNGMADINHFAAAGGMGLLINELLEAGLLHEDVQTIFGNGLKSYGVAISLDDSNNIQRFEAPKTSTDTKIIASCAKPFQAASGLNLLTGNLGKSIVKISAVKPEHRRITAPALIFDNQDVLLDAFNNNFLNRDFVAVLRNQGPRSCGMPELHKLTPSLSVLQDKGHKVALVTDGRMSGASGRVLAAIHLTPEAAAGGPISKLREGDIIHIDADKGVLSAQLSDEDIENRPVAEFDCDTSQSGCGRNLFASWRNLVGPANCGAHGFGENF